VSVPIYIVSSTNRDELRARSADERSLPLNLIVGFTDKLAERQAYIHTAGSAEVWNKPIRELAFDSVFIASLSPTDSFQLGFWLAHELSVI
jgi:hypothetical protein